MTGFDSKRQSAMDKLVEIQEELRMYDDQKQGILMTKEEALKLALEALQAHGTAYLHHELRYEEAITALRLAIDVQNMASESTYKEALAQPEQEPVAWAVYYKGGGSKSLHWPNQHSPDGDATMFEAVPLVPQRPWVGLTDGEIQVSWDGASHGAVFTRRNVYNAFEAKLKEKNT